MYKFYCAVLWLTTMLWWLEINTVTPVISIHSPGLKAFDKICPNILSMQKILLRIFTTIMSVLKRFCLDILFHVLITVKLLNPWKFSCILYGTQNTLGANCKANQKQQLMVVVYLTKSQMLRRPYCLSKLHWMWWLIY